MSSADSPLLLSFGWKLNKTQRRRLTRHEDGIFDVWRRLQELWPHGQLGAYPEKSDALETARALDQDRHPRPDASGSARRITAEDLCLVLDWTFETRTDDFWTAEPDKGLRRPQSLFRARNLSRNITSAEAWAAGGRQVPSPRRRTGDRSSRTLDAVASLRRKFADNDPTPPRRPNADVIDAKEFE